MSKLICPECGEEIKEGQLICDNCNYRLPQPAAPAQPAPSAPAPSAPAPSKPNVPAPSKPNAPAPGKPGSASVNMPESIMAHGDVAVNSSHAEDNSVHTDNSVQNNVQTNVQHSVTDNSQTVNNTNQTVNNNTTILIMGGGSAPLPEGIDENTASAVRQAQQQIADQKPAKPQKEQPSAQPQDGQKGIGSIAGGSAYTPPVASSGSGVKKWIGIIVSALVLIGIIALFIPSETKTNTPEKCITAVQQQVDKGNLRTARKYIRNYENAKDDIIEAYVTLLSKYLDEGKFKDAKGLVEFYGSGEYTQPLNRGLYNYLIATCEYDQAEEYINVEAKPSYREYYAYMEECVKEMSQAGKKEEAKAFIAKKINYFATNTSGSYTKARVEEKLNGIIAKY